MRLLRAITLNGVVAVFVALDVLLVIAAAHHVSESPPSQPVSLELAERSPSPTASPSVPASVPAATQTRLLSFSSAADGWRATPGCGRLAHLAATTNGGRSWLPIAAPVPHVFRIDLTAPAAGWLVGAGKGCAPEFFSTSDGGKTWSGTVGLGQAWVVLVDHLRLPSGSTSAPCGKGEAVEGVAPAGTQVALVVCKTTVLSTGNGGGTWQPVAALPDGGSVVAAALVPDSAGRGVALVSGASSCDALQVLRTSDAGQTWTPGACLAQLALPVAVSLAPDGSGVAIGADGGVAHTTDAGRTWS